MITMGIKIDRKLLDKRYILLLEPKLQLLDGNYENDYFKKVLQLLSEES
jgi:hypothetical protein